MAINKISRKTHIAAVLRTASAIFPQKTFIAVMGKYQEIRRRTVADDHEPYYP